MMSATSLPALPSASLMASMMSPSVWAVTSVVTPPSETIP